MKIAAVTTCPLGVVYTYMAAEALEKAAAQNGIEIKVEIQGSICTENELTNEDIETADLIILAKDTDIKNIERFKDKNIIEISITDAVKNASLLMKNIKNKKGGI